MFITKKFTFAVTFLWVLVFNVLSWGYANSLDDATLTGYVIDRYPAGFNQNDSAVVLLDFGSVSKFWRVTPEQYDTWKLNHAVVVKPKFGFPLGISNIEDLPLSNEALGSLYDVVRWFTLVWLVLTGCFLLSNTKPQQVEL